MIGKILVYLIITAVVAVALDSININQIFKKNKVFQARLFYFLLALSLIYLISNLIFDLSLLIKPNILCLVISPFI